MYGCIVPLSIVSVALSLAIFVTIVVVVMLFVKTKNRQSSVTENSVAAVYEEIQFTESSMPAITDSEHSQVPKTTENIAYSLVPKTTENIAYSLVPKTTENIAYSQVPINNN